MSISDKIMVLLRMCGKRQLDLLEPLQMSSRQSLSNKFTGCRWSAADLVSVANATGTKLSFLLPGGDRVDLN